MEFQGIPKTLAGVRSQTVENKVPWNTTSVFGHENSVTTGTLENGFRVFQNPVLETSVAKNEENRAMNVAAKRSNFDHIFGFSENDEDPVGEIANLSGFEGKNASGVEEDGVEYEFLVGDFVWGKIKSHPWWPGQIYDSSEASKYAERFKQSDCALVAYFGDGTFSWCYPDQMKPFEVNFEEMSKQSNSRSFVKALQDGLDRMSKLVELGMTCSCVSKGNEDVSMGLVAKNGGVRIGAYVPEGGVGRDSITKFEPLRLLENLRVIAKEGSIVDLLEFTVMKGQLSAFYRAKVGLPLPVYHEPRVIVNYEDSIDNGVLNEGDGGLVENAVQGPSEEEWLSTPRRTTRSHSQKIEGISEKKLYERRKQKSMVEIMGGDIDDDDDDDDDNYEGVKKGGELSLSAVITRSRRQTRNSSGEVATGGDSGVNLNVSSEKRKRMTKIDLAESLETTDKEVLIKENEVGGSEEKAKKGSTSRGRKKKKAAANVENVVDVENGGDVENGNDETKDSVPRERKKSKYLSPPYTTTLRDSRKSVDTSESEKETPRIGERITRTISNVVGSPPILKCSEEAFEKASSEEHGSGPLSPKPEQKNTIDPKDIEAPADKALSDMRFAAHSPLSMKANKSLDMIVGFFTTFRSSVYSNGSYYKLYNNNKRSVGRPAKKRKSLDSEIVSDAKDPVQTKPQDPVQTKPQDPVQSQPEDPVQSKPQAMKTRRSKEVVKPETPKETEETESGAALFLIFGPGFTLPSKDALIKIYNKFGPLNVSETEVFYNSSCARVAFMKTSDAKDALLYSQKSTPFGTASVSYRLRYLSATSKSYELDTTPNKRTKTAEKTEPSPLVLIKQNLESIVSVLENSEGKLPQEMKINLEGEFKGLLKKVSAMAGSSSSS